MEAAHREAEDVKSQFKTEVADLHVAQDVLRRECEHLEMERDRLQKETAGLRRTVEDQQTAATAREQAHQADTTVREQAHSTVIAARDEEIAQHRLKVARLDIEVEAGARRARSGLRLEDLAVERATPILVSAAGCALMSTDAPKVSVVIPCFNLGQYLEEAVSSVLSQTMQDFEILIVDDGSTDAETVRLLDDFVRPRTTVFRTDNQGLARARNFLVTRARGEFLCALDADDRLRPQFLERTLQAFDADPSLSFVSTHLQMFGLEARTWPDTARCDLGTLLAEDTVITSALVRATAVREVGGYDEGMPAQGDEDWDLWISLVEAGHRGLILPDLLFDYRRRPGSMCVECTSGDTHLGLIDYLFEKHRPSYEAHLLEAVLHKEGTISDLRRAVVSLEDDLAVRLVPQVARRRAELDALRSELGRARAEEDERRAARAELERLQREVRDLRNSASWRVTGPLRTAYDLVGRLFRRSHR